MSNKRDFTTPIEYEFYEPFKINILILRRISGKEETVPCPFCGRKHIHGSAEGHRCSNCGTGSDIKRKVIHADGTILFENDGYIIRDLLT